MNVDVEQSPSVLIVDDNPLILNVVRSLFASENFNVYASSNGAEALDVLKSKNVDIIICDVMMPSMDGYEFHRRVREQSELSHVAFVFLTALDDRSEINSGKEAGADDYIVKPFDPESLLALVKGKISRSRTLKNASEQKYDSYRKKVIHTLSHEFRTPLVAINTGAELLIDQNTPLDGNKVKGLLEAIRRGGLRLEKLVNDFMLLQQIEAGIARRLYDSRSRILSVNHLVMEYVAAKEESLKEQGFTMNYKDTGLRVDAKVYEPHIHDILERLVSNSIKFKSAIQEIEFFVYPLEHEAVIEVRDRGMGIDVDRVREAIDVFGQLDRERLEQQGGGLGLAIANRYAAINGGRLEFQNRSEGGAIVALHLPRHEQV